MVFYVFDFQYFIYTKVRSKSKCLCNFVVFCDLFASSEIVLNSHYITELSEFVWFIFIFSYSLNV